MAKTAGRQESGERVNLVEGDKPSGWIVPELDFPTFRLGLVAKFMDRLTIRQLSEVSDYSYAEWRVLSRLAYHKDGATVGRIASLAWVDRAEVSRAVATLEKRGLVTRRENPEDRRTPILSLTPTGLEEHHRIIVLRGAFHELLVQDLSGAEREQLDQLLDKVARRLLGMNNGSPTE